MGQSSPVVDQLGSEVLGTQDVRAVTPCGSGSVEGGLEDAAVEGNVARVDNIMNRTAGTCKGANLGRANRVEENELESNELNDFAGDGEEGR